MSNITHVNGRRLPERFAVDDSVGAIPTSTATTYPRLLFLKDGRDAQLLSNAPNRHPAQQETGRILQERRCAAALSVHIRQAPVAPARRNEVQPAGVQAQQERYLLKPELASPGAAGTQQAVINALQKVFAPIVPWVAVSRIKSELQALQADSLQHENEIDMSPEDLAVLAMSPEQLAHFKRIFEAEFQKMSFEGAFPGEPWE